MNYDSVIPDLFSRFPELQVLYGQKFEYMGDESPGQYTVFGSILVPVLQEALNRGELTTIVPICAFIEDVAVSAQEDPRLESLVRIEVGEWLGWVENEELLSPWLGSETKRLCQYVPGLPTQRRSLRAAKNEQRLTIRISSWFRHLRKE
jgi:hypothetical protein